MKVGVVDGLVGDEDGRFQGVETPRSAGMSWSGGCPDAMCVKPESDELHADSKHRQKSRETGENCKDDGKVQGTRRR